MGQETAFVPTTGLIPILLVISLILFGVALVVVGGVYGVRLGWGYLWADNSSPLIERARAAMHSHRMAGLAFVTGPFVGLLVCLVTLPPLVWWEGFGPMQCLGSVVLMLGLGLLAGIVAGGSFYVISELLGGIRKVIKHVKPFGVWDRELDG